MQTQRSSKTDKNFPGVGWVFVEKIGFYKLFPIQKMISIYPYEFELGWQYLFLTFLQTNEAQALRARGGAITEQLNNVESSLTLFFT